MTSTDELARAVELGYRALSARDRTVAEVRRVLERQRVEPAAIEHALGELVAAGVLDDARFARRFAEDKRALESWGPDRIARALHRRGVAAGLIEATVAERTRHDELAAALDLLARKLPGAPSDDRARDRAWRLLVRKGHDPELAYEAVRAHERAVEAA